MVQTRSSVQKAAVLWQRGRHGRLVRSHDVSERGLKDRTSHLSKRRRTGPDSNHGSSTHLSASGLPGLPDGALTPPSDRHSGSIVHSSGLQDLPDELVAHFFSYLPFDEVLRLASVCQSWHSASKLPQAFTSVDFAWVDLLPAQGPHELMDLTRGEYELPPKRSGRLAGYLLGRASSLGFLRLGLVSQNSKRRGMASHAQILDLVSASRNLQTLHLVSSSSAAGLPSKLQQKVLKAVAKMCPRLSHLEVCGATFAKAGMSFPKLERLDLGHPFVEAKDSANMLGRAIEVQSNLKSLSLRGNLRSELHLRARSLTSLTVEGSKAILLSTITCPQLVNVQVFGHVLHNKWTVRNILKCCPWLEQPQDLLIQESDLTRTPYLFLIKWLNSKVVEKIGR